MLISIVATEIQNWRVRCRRSRIQRIQHELAETPKQLQTLALLHDGWLREQAHEARKALILESYHISREASHRSNVNSRCG